MTARRRSEQVFRFFFVITTLLAVLYHFRPWEDFIECCTDRWISKNVTTLKDNLNQNVFGQHIAIKLLWTALSSHWKKDNPKKPLVLSLHGWTGSGKNFVSQYVAESMFKNGARSRFVHLFVSELHFPDHSRVNEYQQQLQTWIKGNVSQCEHSLFIFDEIDKMPPGILDGIKPYMDFHPTVDGIVFRKAVFMFLSNSGGQEIIRTSLDFWKNGLKREDIEYKDLEGLVSKGAFNEEGGLQRSKVIESSLVDMYIPFLPMEKQHVEKCVRKELSWRNVTKNLFADIIPRVMIELTFWPPDLLIYSTTGCKRVSQKIDVILEEILYG